MFSEHFAFQRHVFVNFVGGGGKTELILRLMEEYSYSGSVVYTTTTRIHPPEPSAGLVVISSNHQEFLKLLVEGVATDCMHRRYKLVVTRPLISPELIQGVTPNLLLGVTPDFSRMIDRRLFPICLNEADGARSMSLKLPREGEPVLMEDAEYLVPVIGIDCLFKPLGPETIFRWETAVERYSLRAGEIITPELAASILMHRVGVCKDCVPSTKVVPFINKVDDPAQDAAARELALAILDNGNFPVKSVVWGSARRGRAGSLSKD